MANFCVSRNSEVQVECFLYSASRFLIVVLGEHWSIPYSTAAGREDVDKAGSKCVVYDCVFHEDTYKRGLRDSRFKKLIHDTALQGIESQLNVQLDKVNLKFPKLKFKGTFYH